MGPHELRARAADATVEERFTATAGQRVAVTLTFAPAPAVNLAVPPPAVGAGAKAALVAAPRPSADAAARPIYKRPWFWVATGAAAVIVATVIVVRATSGTQYPSADQTVTGP